jgi:S-(hydroxymethyl)glutathione dehydrogenase/alcohol dehydrogenase
MKTRAAVLHSLNHTLSIEEVEVPTPGPGQVLVKIAFSGVCHSQLMEVQGKRGPDRYLPHLLGHEGSGTVLDVGKGVRKVAPGDRVVLTWIKGEGADSGGTAYHGEKGVINAGSVTTWSQHAIVSENRCVRLDQMLPMDVAALLGCAVPTGAGIVLNTMHPKQEESILIWGVGGVGLSAVMGARVCECRTIIAVDTRESKLGLAREFGATHLVNAASEDPRSRIREIAGEGGVDFAVEAAGLVTTIEMAFDSVRKNGGVCVFASHPPAGERISLNPHDLISGKTIKGSWGGESRPDRDIPRFIELYRDGRLPLEKLITKRYGLAEINDALADLESGTAGRPMLVMDDLE